MIQCKDSSNIAGAHQQTQQNSHIPGYETISFIIVL